MDFSRYAIKNGVVFFSVCGLIVGYLVYIMVRKRRGERPGSQTSESDL